MSDEKKNDVSGSNTNQNINNNDLQRRLQTLQQLQQTREVAYGNVDTGLGIFKNSISSNTNTRSNSYPTRTESINKKNTESK